MWLGTVQKALLTTTASQPPAATVAVDAAGVMHVAFCDAVTWLTGTDTTTELLTRYLRVGPAGP